MKNEVQLFSAHISLLEIEEFRLDIWYYYLADFILSNLVSSIISNVYLHTNPLSNYHPKFA